MWWFRRGLAILLARLSWRIDRLAEWFDRDAAVAEYERLYNEWALRTIWEGEPAEEEFKGCELS